MADAVKRFMEYLAEKSGRPLQETAPGKEMLNAALMLLTDLKRAVTETQGMVCLRRLTEAEAKSEQALSLVRARAAGRAHHPHQLSRLTTARACGAAPRARGASPRAAPRRAVPPSRSRAESTPAAGRPREARWHSG